MNWAKSAIRPFFLCGPAGFMEGVKEILISMGARAEQIRQERFSVETAPAADGATATYTVEFARSGGVFTASSMEPLLAIAERHDIDLPYSLPGGAVRNLCGAGARGDVVMETDEGLEPERRVEGYRLMCVGRARSNLRLDA